MYCKLAFVFFVCASTLIIFLILLMVNLSAKVDYILNELFFNTFIFLSFVINNGKKLAFNPTAT